MFFNQTFMLWLVYWPFFHPKNRTTLPLNWSYASGIRNPSGTFINSWKVPKTCVSLKNPCINSFSYLLVLYSFLLEGKKKNPAKIVNGLGGVQYLISCGFVSSNFNGSNNALGIKDISLDRLAAVCGSACEQRVKNDLWHGSCSAWQNCSCAVETWKKKDRQPHFFMAR